MVNRDMRILGVYSPLRFTEARSHVENIPPPTVAKVIHIYASTKPVVGDYIGSNAPWRCHCCGGKGRCIA